MGLADPRSPSIEGRKNPAGASPTNSTSNFTIPIPPAKAKACPDSFDSRAVPGVAIGSAFFGALLAVLILYFMKRSKRSGRGRHRPSRDIDVEKPPAPRTEVSLEENFIERVDDSQIRKSMQDLSELIDQHVENYYHLQPFEGSHEALERQLGECGYLTDLLAKEMSTVLANPKSRFNGIRQLIAKVILTNTGFTARAGVSLLPPHIAGLCQSVPPVERQPGCEEVFEKAFTKWRQLSAFLLSPSRANREPPKANQRELQGAIGQNVNVINSVLKPFIKSDSEMQRYQKENLSAIVFEGAQLALLLFCQTSVWVFEWEPPTRDDSSGRGKGGLQITTSDFSAGRTWIVFPGIGEKVERHGRQKVRPVASPVAV